MFWDQAYHVVTSFLPQALSALALLSLVAFIAGVASMGMALSLKKRYRKLMLGRCGVDLEELLNHYGGIVAGCLEQQRQTELRVKTVEQKLQRSLAGIGLVRYNAFRDTGSDLSFSLALLDYNLDGVVITSIYGREESRCYGKPVSGGESIHHLSDEERQALAEARQKVQFQKKGRPKRSR